MRLIDAELLTSKISFTGFPHIDRNGRIDKSRVYELINSCPTVEKRSCGEWETVYFSYKDLNAPQKASMFDFVKCPFCETIHQGRHHFCSWCGADMRGDNNDAT